MKQMSGEPAPDDPDWYHAGHPVDLEEALRLQAAGLPAYRPTDPRATNQRPYIDFASEDRTPKYQQEEAK